MKINLQSLKFNARPHLIDFVNEKVGKLERFEDKIISAEVSLYVQDGKHVDNKACDIRLVIPGNDLIVKRSATTFEAAVLSGVETLQNMLNRKREKSTFSGRSELAE